MAGRDKRNILWEIGCPGHTDSWVTAESWELATVAAAEFWGVPWREVAARCELKKKIVGAPRNICCRCKRICSGPPRVCTACAAALRTEEDICRRRRARAYQTGKLL